MVVNLIKRLRNSSRKTHDQILLNNSVSSNYTYDTCLGVVKIMSEWIKYTGSDEQIAKLSNAKYGVCLRFEHGHKSFVYSLKDISKTDGKVTLSNTVTHYLICNPHPLADMICQQARTGQPVWVSYIKDLMVLRPGDKSWRKEIICTTTPDWNIPGAEYSFTEFKEEV